MNTRFCRYLAIQFSFLAMASAIAATQTGSQQKQLTGLSAVRAINTAEMRFQRTTGHYGALSDLISSGQFSKLHVTEAGATQPFLNVESPNPEDAVPGYKLKLSLASANSGYSVLLTDSSASCGTVFFSNESGVIYQGQALGCTTEASNGVRP